MIKKFGMVKLTAPLRLLLVLATITMFSVLLARRRN